MKRRHTGCTVSKGVFSSYAHVRMHALKSKAWLAASCRARVRVRATLAAAPLLCARFCSMPYGENIGYDGCTYLIWRVLVSNCEDANKIVERVTKRDLVTILHRVSELQRIRNNTS